MTTILSIVPYLRSEKGHFFNYHRAANQAADKLGWRYIVAAPKENNISCWPQHWQRCLENPNPTFSPQWLSGLWTKHRYRSSLSTFFKQQADPDRNAANIVFMEYISLRQLRPVVVSLLRRPARNLSVWMLFRLVPDKLPGKAKGFQRCMRLLSRALGPNRVHLLVDTHELVPHYERFLDLPIHVVPIPHTSDVLPPRMAHPQGKYLCWIRGLPKPNHGMAVLEKLLQSGSKKLKLIFSDAAFATPPESPVEYEILPETLSGEHYRQCMADSDFVILPYSPILYNSNSSGVFVEAVTYGKIPLVSEGTWTAAELRRHNLPELILDWDRPDLADEIPRLAADPSVRTRLRAMQEAYQRYHCIESFSQRMAEIHS